MIYCIVALIVKIFGKNWIDKLLPPVIIGPMIIIIGMSLAPNAITQMGLGATSLDWKVILVGIITFLVTALTAVGAKGFFKVIPILNWYSNWIYYINIIWFSRFFSDYKCILV